MRRRIAMISEHASPLADLGSVDSGGQNVYVAQLSRHLVSLGYQVDIFTRRDDESLPEIYEWAENLRVIHVPAGPARFVHKEELLDHMGDFTRFMIEFFRQQGQPYDLVHANFWMSGLVAADLKATLGTPFVITFHALGRIRRKFQGQEDRFPEQRFEIEQRIAAEANAIIAECPQDKVNLIEHYQADPARIREIPCGFDPRELWPVERSQARRKIGVPQDEWIVLQLGRMVPRKGVAAAIRGFAEFARQPDVRARMLVVGGESRNPSPDLTPEIGRLQEIARQEGVEDLVRFEGRRSRQELKYYFSAADVFISTPWYEPFGITPLESMACGTPVIGSNVGGIKFTVLDGQTGYLVPPDDPGAISAHLLEMYRDPPRVARMRDRCLRRVNESFTWEKVALQVSALYHEILSEARQLQANLADSGSAYEELSERQEEAVIAQAFESALETLHRSWSTLDRGILRASEQIIGCLARGSKVMVCGNGGSAADAQHFSAEMVGRFISSERRGLPFLALTTDSAFMTAWSNDVGYSQVFARQVEALGRPGDLLIGISTSGRSANLLEAFDMARRMEIETLAILGGDGGDLMSLSDMALVVPAWNTQRIQEVQILILHLLCELVERHIQNATWVDRRSLAFPVEVERSRNGNGTTEG